jgi:uncharacterized protein (TIGR00255 family)
MTAFAQVKSQFGSELGFTVSLKSVNHRFLDLQLRLPADTDALEMKLRRLLKDKLARGHVELTLSIERIAANGAGLNRELVGAYVNAFRTAAKEFGVNAEPDLNAILRMPGAMSASVAPAGEEFENAVVARAEEAIAALNRMRAEEGKGIERELRDRAARLAAATSELEKLRGAVAKAHYEKLSARMQELLPNSDPDRLLQEAALLAERSDIQEEIARMHTHIEHFLGLLAATPEIGKKLDFLLQEMNRETNTLLSKTAGVSGEGTRITELGLAMKSEIEKLREQVQNIE